MTTVRRYEQEADSTARLFNPGGQMTMGDEADPVSGSPRKLRWQIDRLPGHCVTPDHPLYASRDGQSGLRGRRASTTQYTSKPVPGAARMKTAQSHRPRRDACTMLPTVTMPTRATKTTTPATTRSLPDPRIRHQIPG